MPTLYCPGFAFIILVFKTSRGCVIMVAIDALNRFLASNNRIFVKTEISKDRRDEKRKGGRRTDMCDSHDTL